LILEYIAEVLEVKSMAESGEQKDLVEKMDSVKVGINYFRSRHFIFIWKPPSS